MVLIIVASTSYSHHPLAFHYYPFSSTGKPPISFLQLRRNDAHASQTSLTRKKVPILCDECDKSQPNPCGSTGLYCLRGMCVAKSNDVKTCRGDLSPGGLCEICIPELRDCASGLECFLHHCIKKKNEGSKICSEKDDKCSLAVLRQCSGSTACQRCGGGLPACAHQLRCVDGRCAASFNKREKCDEDIKQRKKERQNDSARLEQTVRIESGEKIDDSVNHGKQGRKNIKCKRCRHKSDCFKKVCDSSQKKCPQKDCYNGFCAKTEKMAMRCSKSNSKEMRACETCKNKKDCVKTLCGGDAKKCDKVKCIDGFCAENQKAVAKCVEIRIISNPIKS